MRNLSTESRGHSLLFMIAPEQGNSRAMQVAIDATFDLPRSSAELGRYKRVGLCLIALRRGFAKLLYDAVTLLGLYDAVTFDN